MLSLTQYPVFDDFDASKNYQKILFVPANPVQARELTQIQSILQNQIKMQGDHLFKNGTVVIPGHVYYDPDVIYVTVNTFYNGINADTAIASLIGLNLTNPAGVVAHVVYAVPSTSTDATTLFIKYISAAGTINTFSAAEVLTNTATNLTLQVSSTTNFTGRSSVASVQAGVYYVNGYFIGVDAQTTVVGKYTNNISASVGLQLAEKIITPAEDSTLYDNAYGFTNYGAPGANRYQIKLNLITKTTAVEVTSDTLDYIELIQVKNGVLQSLHDSTQYSQINTMLAERTYDEAGDYVVKPFSFSVSDYRTNNRGQWATSTPYLAGDYVSNAGNYYYAVADGVSSSTALTHAYGTASDGSVSWTQVTYPTYNDGAISSTGTTIAAQKSDEAMLAITSSPGRAYIKGFEIDIQDQRLTTASKARATKQTDLNQIYVPSGSYVTVTGVTGMPAMLTIPSATIWNAAGNQIGTCYIRSMELASGTVGQGSASYRLFIFGITMSNSVHFQSAASVIKIGSSFIAPIVTTSLALSGYITTTASTTVTGKGSLFTVELTAGDSITVGGVTRIVNNIVNDVTLTVTSAFSGTFSTDAPATVSVATLTELGKYIQPMAHSYIRTLRDVNGAIDTSYNFLNYTTFTTTGTTQTLTTSTPGESYALTGHIVAMTASSATSTASSIALSVSGALPVMTIGGSITGTFAVGQVISGTGVVPGTYIVGILTGGGGAGTASVSQCPTVVSSTAINANSQVVAPSYSYVGGNPQQLLISGLTSSTAYTMINAMTRSGAAAKEKTKTLQTQTLTINNTDVRDEYNNVVSTQTFLNSVIGLGKADVQRVIKVTMSGDVSPTTYQTSGETNITSYFTLQPNQTAEAYWMSTITKNANQRALARPIRVTFEYFLHSSGDYFSVDSYSSIPYSKIPSVTIGEVTYSLRDCLDFRARRSNANDNFTGTGSSVPDPLISTSTLATSYSYYLPRVDIMSLTKAGIFEYKEGNSSDLPTAPKATDNALQLATLTLPPYSEKANQIGVTNISHKRYTMEEIGKLETRLSNVETYVSLSQLEATTSKFTVYDQNGLSRYKNGFIADQFKDISLFDTKGTFSSSIDIFNQELHPKLNAQMIPLAEPAGITDAARLASGYRLTGNYLTLPYTETPLISQTVASHSEYINPFAVFRWSGAVTITPQVDNWQEVNTNVSTVTLDGGIHYNTVTTNNITNATGNTAPNTSIYARWGWPYNYFNYYTLAPNPNVGSTTTTSTITSSSSSTSLKTTNTLLSDVTTVLGNVPASTARSIPIMCEVRAMKPFTKIYAFLDGNNIDTLVTQCATIVVTTTGAFIDYRKNVAGTEFSYSRDIETANTVNPGWSHSNLLSNGEIISVTVGGTTTTAVVIAQETQLDFTTLTSQKVLYVALPRAYTSNPAVYTTGTFTAGMVVKGLSSGVTATVVSYNAAPSQVTNSNGSWFGYVTLPNFTYSGGDHIIGFDDAPDGSSSISRGMAQFTANGLIEQAQETITTRKDVWSTTNITNNIKNTTVTPNANYQMYYWNTDRNT